MPQDFVFVGPSLPRTQVEALLPGASILPPVKHGDVLRLDARAGDRVLIIDGLFLQAAPVRHKEILTLLADGVTVAGSSSMGALRAAELHRYGMRGVGEVFELYRGGVIDGDDEVAVVHTTAEDDRSHRALSEPLVSIRVAIGEAARDGAITSDTARALLRIAKGLPFRLRGRQMLIRSAREQLAVDVVDQFEAWYRDHARDLKAEDAVAMLTRAAAGDPALSPHGPGDRRITNATTGLVLNWTGRARGATAGGTWASDSDLTSVIMLFHPGHPDAYRRQVLAKVAGLPVDAADLEAAALAEGARHGVDAAAVSETGAWLSEREAGELAADPGFADEAVLRVLARGFGTVRTGATNTRCMPRALDDEDTRAWARRLAAEAIEANRRVPKPDRPGALHRMRFRNDVVDRVFAALWGVEVEHLPEAAWDHGFASLATFRLIAEPFVARVRIGPAIEPPPRRKADD